MKIALAPYGLRGYRGKPGASGYKEGVKTLLRRVRDIGYEGIEMAAPQGFTPQEYKEFLDGIGLKVTSANGIPDVLDREDFTDIIEQCKILESKNVMIGAPPSLVLGNPFELEQFIKKLNRAGKALIAEGIHLSYHNHAIDFSKINGKTMFEQIVEGTETGSVFIEPDTHWIQAGGGHVITWLKKLKGRIYVVHFKDYGIDPYSDHAFLEGTHKLFMEVGEGNLNWPGIIAECKEQNIEWCAVEQDDCQRPVYESIAISLKNLREFGA